VNRFVVLTFLLTITLGACEATPAGDGITTPIELTAGVSTVIAETPGPSPTEGPSPTVVPATQLPTLSSGASPTELKYRVLEEFPDFFFCDPDFYPVARGDEMTRAQERFPEIQANQEEFKAILDHIGLSGMTTFTDEEKLEIYREHKKLNAIHFDVAGAAYQFQIKTGQEGLQGSFVTGRIDAGGSIEILQQDSGLITCPICLAAGTLIDTPRGPVRVEELRIGDPVWTQDEAGRRVAASILKVGSLEIPSTHQMVHVILGDGRELRVSPGHPTADGLRLVDLQIGGSLDGAQVIHIEYVPYGEMYTYDILSSGATGFYWANEILMGSTLAGP
jgi:hypothetical protein